MEMSEMENVINATVAVMLLLALLAVGVVIVVEVLAFAFRVVSCWIDTPEVEAICRYWQGDKE